MKKSRKATIRIVWAGIDKNEIKNLRKEVEKAIQDPDYVLIANYPIEWNEVEIDRDALFRMVWAEDISKSGISELKKQVEKALADPSYIIVTNYPVQWVEIPKIRH
jgi:hypothetical protein